MAANIVEVQANIITTSKDFTAVAVKSISKKFYQLISNNFLLIFSSKHEYIIVAELNIDLYTVCLRNLLWTYVLYFHVT